MSQRIRVAAWAYMFGLVIIVGAVRFGWGGALLALWAFLAGVIMTCFIWPMSAPVETESPTINDMLRRGQRRP